ncbi:hypothetical protein ACQY0O_006402 [Thecaphora frezii]
MKLFTTVLGFAAVAMGVASATAVEASHADVVVRDTHESGLSILGARGHERKARHLQASASPEELKKRNLFKHGKLTWYSGGQLSNPACGGPTPGDDEMVVAVKENGGYGDCGDTVHIHWKGKVVSAKIRDYCAGCELAHIDATKGVFSQLDDLEKGVLDGIHFKVIPKN